MRLLVPASFRAQIVIISAASASMLLLAGMLIRDVIARTEGQLLAEAEQQCRAASRELKLQYEERVSYGGDSLQDLPIPAQDVALTGLTATVLRSYEGVEGGFYREAGDTVLGYAFPAGARRGKLSLTEQERSLLLSTARAANAGSETVTRTAEWQNDIAVTVMEGLGPGEGFAWAMKRLSGVRDPVLARRRWWLVALVLSAMLGMGGIVSVWFFLRGGVSAIGGGLRRLEQDFTSRLPAIRGEFGEISRAINQMADRRMTLEAELRRRDRLAALGKVVAGVAHEIRNPLNSMRLTLELLERRMNKGAAGPEEVKAALQQIDRLDLILARLLAFGRPALQDRRVQDVLPLMHDAVKMVEDQCRRKDVRIVIHTAGLTELLADVDGPQITQVLINLLLNAIEASPPSGVVEMRAGVDNKRVRLTVTDYGPGIRQEAQPHVFDAYFTTKPDGTGLGLSVSREIVANHGGELDFESSPGRTVFRVLLPVEGNS